MTDSVKALKILVAGNVNGNMSHLLERVCSFTKKMEFDALIIVGCLFTPADSPEDLEWMDHVNSYFPRYRSLPDDIYILSPAINRLPSEILKFYRQLVLMGRTDSLITEQVDKLIESGTDVLSGRMALLGTRSIFDCMSGLKLAYFTGDESTGVTENHLESFNLTLSSSSSSSSNCDIFLSSCWPANITQNSSVEVPAEVASFSSNHSSRIVAKAVSLAQPRYHFSCSDSLFYERQPYRNHQVLAETTRPVTRFISIADVPPKTADKNAAPKWIYAFNLKPASKLLQLDKDKGSNAGRRELISQPDDTTESPFSSMDLSISAKKPNDKSDNGQFFYQMPSKKQHQQSNQSQNSGNKRPHQSDQSAAGCERNDDQVSQGRQEKEARRNEPLDPSNCWFCLSSANVEKEYIITIGDHCYLALAKGGLVEDHVLILPIDHIRSSLEATDELLEEIVKFKTCLTNFFAKIGKDVAFFERNFKSQHMQIQAVPIPSDYLQEDRDHLASLSQEAVASDPVESTSEETSATNKDGAGDEGKEESAKDKRREGPTGQLVKGIINYYHLRYRQIEKDERLSKYIEKMLPYFHIEIPSIHLNLFVIINTRKKDAQGRVIQFPLQIGREILARILRLDMDSIDWRSVTTNLTKNQEAARTIKFRQRFEPFDFTNDL